MKKIKTLLILSLVFSIAACSTVRGNKQLRNSVKAQTAIDAKSAGIGASKGDVEALWGRPDYTSRSLDGETYFYNYSKVYAPLYSYIPVVTFWLFSLNKYKVNTISYLFGEDGKVKAYSISEDIGNFRQD